MKLYLGIDPGKTGAAAALSDDGKLFIHDWSDPQSADLWVRELLIDRYAIIPMAVIENVDQRKMPRKYQGSAYMLGMSVGHWQMLMSVYGIPYQMIDPKQWQAAFTDPRDRVQADPKKRSLASARRFMPGHGHFFERVKDHNRADAALMACYAQRIAQLERMRIAN